MNTSTNSPYVNNLGLIQYKQSSSKEGYTTFQFIQKRIIDFCLSTIIFFSVLPIIFYSILRIKRESIGPVFFKQTRIGIDGKPFVCYKFRSMYIDGKFNPYTQTDDPRIFPFGRVMRKYRIDELPQLINVIKGDMHLIGPRAEWDILVRDYEKIIPNYHKRHTVRPGITGLAQVMYPYGQDIRDTKKKLKYDLYYIKQWNFWLEFKVIWRTFLTVVKGKGL